MHYIILYYIILCYIISYYIISCCIILYCIIANSIIVYYSICYVIILYINLHIYIYIYTQYTYISRDLWPITGKSPSSQETWPTCRCCMASSSNRSARPVWRFFALRWKLQSTGTAGRSLSLSFSLGSFGKSPFWMGKPTVNGHFQ